jgi:uncharacterized RDD family membrane protein YckC
MALVASPARSSGLGSVTQHGPQPSPDEGYEHPQPASGDLSHAAVPLPSAITQPKQPAPESHLGPYVEPERFRAAGLLRRAAAVVVDLALLLPVCGLFGLTLCLLFKQPIPRLAELSPDLLIAALLDGNAASEALLALSGILFFLYFFVFHAARGQTPGKKLLGLRVIDAYGARPGLLRTLLRTASYLLSLLPCSLGFLWIGFDRERRALHDWVAGTYVVRVQ